MSNTRDVLNSKQRVFLDDPVLGSLEKEYLVRAIDSTYVSTVGPFVPEFEEKFAAYVGAKRAVAVQSGTAALHMALYQLGIGPGDEVIVPSLTFIASVNPVLYVGARPVIVDVDPNTWTMSPSAVEAVINPHTRAIMPVHLYGNPCDMDALTNLAEAHQIAIIEDATESLGAEQHGRKTGTLGLMGCFSFNGNKVLTTGGGGMIVTDDDRVADHVKYLVNQARDPVPGYSHSEMGFNYRMTNLEAAMGLAQLERLPHALALKREFRRIYSETFSDTGSLVLQKEHKDSQSSFWFSAVSIHGSSDVDSIQLALKREGIPSRRHFRPLGDMPYLARYAQSCPVADNLYATGLCLPSSAKNTRESVVSVASSMMTALKSEVQ
jgi:perosamine synthetase